MDVAVSQFRETLTALMRGGSKRGGMGSDDDEERLIEVGVLDWILVSYVSCMFQQLRDRVVSIVTLAQLLMEDDSLLDDFISAWDQEDNWAQLDNPVHLAGKALDTAAAADAGRCPICMTGCDRGLAVQTPNTHACIQPWLRCAHMSDTQRHCVASQDLSSSGPEFMFVFAPIIWIFWTAAGRVPECTTHGAEFQGTKS